MNYTTLVQNIKDFMEDDGTEFSNAIAAALSPNEKISLQEMKAIVFGHSQAGRFGETLKSKIESQGGEIFPKSKGDRVNGGQSDQQLAESIKNISPDEGPFTHAYLFLGGNSAVPGTKRGEIVDQAKREEQRRARAIAAAEGKQGRVLGSSSTDDTKPKPSTM